MRKIIKKALGPLAIFAMALGVGLSVIKTKDAANNVIRT